MKKLILLLFAMVCILGLIGCSNKNMTFNIGQASMLNIKSALTGDEVNVASNELIQGITENINSLRFEKTSATDGNNDYAYELTWFEQKGNQIAKITITEENGYQISHEGYYYKVGADQSIDIALIDEMLDFSLASIPITSQKQLTLEEVIELSAKGKALTWSDFAQYTHEDIGSGLYIYRYDIDSYYELRIGGVPTGEPMYIRLVSKANRDNYIDIRTENVHDFINPIE